METTKKLERSVDNRMIGGVAAGVAEYFDLDPTLVRVVWAILFVFGGVGFLLYLIMWIIMPEKKPEPPAEPAAETTED